MGIKALTGTNEIHRVNFFKFALVKLESVY